ncbi:MAG: PHP domain-containing protein [Chloroflexi bacterium]|nr:PHP domain-containing protein [Chloroflexota bacterium]
MDSDFKCELHMHSTYSDGSVTPEGLLEHAQQIGLSVVAITDHDNAHGSRAAVPAAARLGIELIPAIELTGRWDDCYRPGWGGDVDILGYFVDLDDPHFRRVEQATLDDIQGRIEACCARLTAAGYPVTMDDVFAQNPRYGGARQLRQALQARGYVDNYDESIELFTEHWQHVRLSCFTIEEHIATIRAAGGVAVLAHPQGIRCGEGWIGADRLARVVEMGIDGIEIYHRHMDEAARAHFMPLAEQFSLLISGGSDEHGFSPDLPHMGGQPVTRAMVEGLRARHIERRAALDAAHE